MKTLFRRDKEKDDAIEPANTYHESQSRSDARWAKLDVFVHAFPFKRVESPRERRLLVGSPNSVEHVFEAGTVVIYTPERKVKTHDLSEETTTFPEHIGVFKTVRETDTDGAPKKVLKLLFYLEPKRRIFYDYTDPDHPNGKTVTNTAEPHFQAVEQLIYDVHQKKDDTIRRSYF